MGRKESNQIKSMKISQTETDLLKICIAVTELWCVQVFFYNIQRGITQKLRDGEQSFLCWPHRLDLIYISIKYPEDILKRRTAPSHSTAHIVCDIGYPSTKTDERNRRQKSHWLAKS